MGLNVPICFIIILLFTYSPIYNCSPFRCPPHACPTPLSSQQYYELQVRTIVVRPLYPHIVIPCGSAGVDMTNCHCVLLG